jgi:hypothetical protein
MSQFEFQCFFIQTNECDLDLRLQHFHSFSKHGEGGHYHYDTTPETVEYEGYFNVGHRIVRIDKPIVNENLIVIFEKNIHSSVLHTFRSLIPSVETRTSSKASMITKLKTHKIDSHNFHSS